MVTITTELIESKRDDRGRQIRSRDEREGLVRAYRESGLTQKAFAAREGVRYSTFVSWIQETKRSPSARPTFAEVSLPGPAFGAALEIVLPDGVVVRGADVERVITAASRLRRC
ncbi:MAG: hypothetical protein ABIZ04_18645 [Opitutus sp.]